MKFKDIEPVYTDDAFYDLFHGGYIDPAMMLEDSDDIHRVEEAMETIIEFMNDAQNAGVLDIQ